MIKPLIRLLAMILFAAAQTAMAATIYVRADATGANTGSDWTNAHTSLPATLARGNTYYVADGTYVGRTFSTPDSGTTPIAIVKATPSDHGTDTGWSDAYGDGQAAFSSGFVFASSYWVIDGKTGGGAENRWVGNFGFKITETRDSVAIIQVGGNGTSNNVTIRHVDFQGKGSVSGSGGGYSNDGLAIWGSSDITLSYFRMRGIGRCPFFMGPRNAVIEHGWVESFNGSDAVHSEVASIWAIGGAIGDVTFRHNLITDIRVTGGIMWDNSSNPNAKLNVYGNVFYKPAGKNWDVGNGMIGGWTGGNGERFHNAKVYNNTFINVDQSTLSPLPNIFSGNEAYNNLFYNSNSPNFSRFASHNYNHFINSGGVQSEANGSTSSGDPFVDYVGLDFRLKSATSAGASFPAPFNVDPLGKIRGGDGVADRGAYEFAGAGGVALAAPTGLQVR